MLIIKKCSRGGQPHGLVGKLARSASVPWVQFPGTDLDHCCGHDPYTKQRKTGTDVRSVLVFLRKKKNTLDEMETLQKNCK